MTDPTSGGGGRPDAAEWLREALVSIAVMRQEAEDWDHPDFDWRHLAHRMEAVAALAAGGGGRSDDAGEVIAAARKVLLHPHGSAELEDALGTLDAALTDYDAGLSAAPPDPPSDDAIERWRDAISAALRAAALDPPAAAVSAREADAPTEQGGEG